MSATLLGLQSLLGIQFLNFDLHEKIKILLCPIIFGYVLKITVQVMAPMQ